MPLTTAANQALVVFARAPVEGQVKTRLAAELGAAAALAIYRELVERTIGAARGSSSWSLTVAHTPHDASAVMRDWLGSDIALWPQPDLDLGGRMEAAIAMLRSGGAQRVVVIGTDCPDMTTSVIQDAFDRLSRHDVVVGPAHDGGYYLIGMSGMHPSLFQNIPWSSARTLEVTLERARSNGLSVALLEAHGDIDTGDDWHAWVASRDGRDATRKPTDSRPLPRD